MNRALILATLLVALGASANCVMDPPEMGDIGPSAALVCNRLGSQLPGASLVIEGRSIHSPTEVSVVASVNGTPVSLRYELFGYTWRLDERSVSDAKEAWPETEREIGDLLRSPRN
ncbi:MAG: hypothetical protein LJE70_13300 [Chromatiaceae bacterium]|nr:hypothetical protein [Chromatiaceae bacterium]